MIRNGCNILKNDGRQWHNIRVAGFTGGSLQYNEWAVVHGNMRSTEGMKKNDGLVAAGDAADPDGTRDLNPTKIDVHYKSLDWPGWQKGGQWLWT